MWFNPPPLFQVDPRTSTISRSHIPGKSMVTNRKELMKEIQAKIELSGKSVRLLEAETGISKSHINRIQNGSDSVALDILFDLAEHFEIRYRFEGPKKKTKK